jgi:hypothetical protein
MMLGPIARALSIFAMTLAVILLVMSGRAVFEARARAAEANLALAAGDVDLAIVQLRRSARWYAPLNVYASRSLTNLEQLALRAESAGEHARALMAWRSLHAAIQATRSFYTPHAEQLARADDHIATLMAREPPAKIEGGRSEAQRKGDYLALLVPHDPSLFGVLLALVGFATWVGSAAVFLSRGVDSEGRILRAVARRSVFCLLLGWIAFAVGLRIA